MKIRLVVFSILLVVFFVANASAQKVNPDKLPEYVVLSAREGSLITNFDVDIKIIKTSKYANELKKLEAHLDNSDVVGSYNDLLNEMFEIGYVFLESFERNETGSKHNLIFRKKK